MMSCLTLIGCPCLPPPPPSSSLCISLLSSFVSLSVPAHSITTHHHPPPLPPSVCAPLCSCQRDDVDDDVDDVTLLPANHHAGGSGRGVFRAQSRSMLRGLRRKTGKRGRLRRLGEALSEPRSADAGLIQEEEEEGGRCRLSERDQPVLSWTNIDQRDQPVWLCSHSCHKPAPR